MGSLLILINHACTLSYLYAKFLELIFLTTSALHGSWSTFSYKITCPEFFGSISTVKTNRNSCGILEIYYKRFIYIWVIETIETVKLLAPNNRFHIVRLVSYILHEGGLFHNDWLEQKNLFLKLVSAIFNEIFIFHQMIAPQKPWKMFFIPSEKLFLFSRYSHFCVSIFNFFPPCQPLF